MASLPAFSPALLEAFVDSTQTLPLEIQRVLATVRDLDEKAQRLDAVIEQKTNELVATPPAKPNSPQAKEIAEARAELEKMHLDLVQLSTEKGQLAQRCLDLVDENALRLDAELQRHDHEVAEYRKRAGIPAEVPPPQPAPVVETKAPARGGGGVPTGKRSRGAEHAAAGGHAAAEQPRPSKRARAAPADVAEVGHHVAAHVRDPRDHSVQWILARIQRIHQMPDGGTSLEVVDDEALQAGDEHSTYLVKRDAAVSLPRSNEVKAGYPNHQPGSLVLAVYPGTTVFYRATVVAAARKTKGGAYGEYQLEFDDDTEEGSTEIPKRTVPFRHVVAAPSFMQHANYR
ncbi:hypothetical protein PPROV_000614300 [Pycnococcus provasolii]|uniref:SGF29 C-terminal domain-containing protein n=2 Tax=Pycnococcus provasolii TaxID=41880 RepID=A0A830HPM9_9CHLO|nr:hypothetical protein PPROV_000614300 [Pycnococcus provasolii]